MRMMILLIDIIINRVLLSWWSLPNLLLLSDIIIHLLIVQILQLKHLIANLMLRRSHEILIG